MNIEKVEFDHFKNIEELIKHLEMWYAEDDYSAYDRHFSLRDARIMGMYIYQLQQENQASKQTINELSNKIAKLVEEKVLLRIQISSREEVANDLQQRINKAIHRIQLLQMDNEVTVRDLGLIARDLKGEVNEI